MIKQMIKRFLKKIIVVNKNVTTKKD